MSTPKLPEDELFISTTRAFLDREAPVSRIRELHAEGVQFDRDWWRRAAELGWTSLLVSEELGGGSISGDGVADLAHVAEAMGTVAAPGPLIPVSVVLTALSESRAHTDVITALIEGQATATWAVYDARRPFAPQTSTTVATPIDGGYRLDGVKDRVEAGTASDYFLVCACEGGDIRQFLVPADTAGLTVSPLASIDLVRGFAAVSLDGAEVPSSAAVGSSQDAPTLIARQCQVAQVLQCAETVGALQTVFDFTVEWALDRHSFGRPLASYQALKHRFADLKMHLESCRAATGAAVREVAERSPGAALAVSAAKAYLGEYASTAVQDCIQLHGGIGVTWEHDLHIYLRRIAQNRFLFGTPEQHHAAVYQHFDDLEPEQ